MQPTTAGRRLGEEVLDGALPAAPEKFYKDNFNPQSYQIEALKEFLSQHENFSSGKFFATCVKQAEALRYLENIALPHSRNSAFFSRYQNYIREYLETAPAIPSHLIDSLQNLGRIEYSCSPGEFTKIYDQAEQLFKDHDAGEAYKIFRSGVSRQGSTVHKISKEMLRQIYHDACAAVPNIPQAAILESERYLDNVFSNYPSEESYSIWENDLLTRYKGRREAIVSLLHGDVWITGAIGQRRELSSTDLKNKILSDPPFEVKFLRTALEESLHDIVQTILPWKRSEDDYTVSNTPLSPAALSEFVDIIATFPNHKEFSAGILAKCLGIEESIKEVVDRSPFRDPADSAFATSDARIYLFNSIANYGALAIIYDRNSGHTIKAIYGNVERWISDSFGPEKRPLLSNYLRDWLESDRNLIDS